MNDSALKSRRCELAKVTAESFSRTKGVLRVHEERGGASNPFRAPAVNRIRRRLACIGETNVGEGLAAFRAKSLNRFPCRKKICMLIFALKLLGCNCQKLQPSSAKS